MKWIGTGVAIAVCLCFAALLFLVLHPVQGWRAQVILSGSMRPTIAPGTLIFTRKQPEWTYREGDIITFHPPIKTGSLVTHRLTRVYLNAHSIRVFDTKGDANINGDGWQISPGSVVGRYRWGIPYVGYLLVWVKTPIGFLVFTLIFFFSAVLPELFFLWGELSKQKGG
ncbi:signal peptidase I [Patescibacteria group bacterium]|nr:signal peptidase I [Patescibacteria group bacterium]